MRDLDSARRLATTLLEVAALADRQASAWLTDMAQPLGRAIGHALECAEALDCLRGAGPADLRELSLALTVEMARLAGLGSQAALTSRAVASLDSGAAYERFLRMAAAQGADRRALERQDYGLQIAPLRRDWKAQRPGFVRVRDAAQLGLALLPLHAARATRESQLDLSTGLQMLVREGDSVAAGQPLVGIRAQDAGDADRCASLLERAIAIEDERPAARPLLLERIAPDQPPPS
jgi:pyrimidine-nucleoside phosphorylase